MESKITSNKNPDSRFLLAMIISAISISGIIIISGLFIRYSEDKSYAAQSIFNAILPMIGTWIGAIIAYYFGARQVQSMQEQQERITENFNRESNANIEVIREVKDIMRSQADQIRTIFKIKQS